jgi:hypothetical protein
MVNFTKVLIKKAGEYAKGGDRYFNFKDAANMLGTTPEKALLGMWAKHQSSINTRLEIDKKWYMEKYGDAYNYGVLLLGLMFNTEEFHLIDLLVEINLYNDPIKNLKDQFERIAEELNKRVIDKKEIFTLVITYLITIQRKFYDIKKD